MHVYSDWGVCVVTGEIYQLAAAYNIGLAEMVYPLCSNQDVWLN